jgi:SpoVK/Ycf46/Vps4 family AAA+-type ATPase
MSEGHDLELLLKSHLPLIIVESHEESRLLQLLTAQAMKQYRPLYRWSITDGLQRVDLDLSPEQNRASAEEVLWKIRKAQEAGIYVLSDFHPYLDEPLHVRLLKDIALAHAQSGNTVILLSHRLELPPELNHFAAEAHLTMPGQGELEKIVRETAQEWRRKNHKSVMTDNESFRLLVQNLSGLTEGDARRLARTAIFDDGTIDASDMPAVIKAKHALLRGDALLTFEFDTAPFNEVGGLSRLKGWLQQRKGIFRGEQQATPLDPPRGILLLGVQGGGKSLAAKATAAMFEVPLLRLDFATLYNKFHGETERNLRESLRSAEAMAPCVLWIDEIEKGIATGSNDGGTSLRVLGTLLTWLAERKAAVFLVATANDIERLPAELVRKGRFDEIFFVDLPERAVREEIFAIHLQKRGLMVTEFDLALLATQSEGFSGAEIEQAVVSALYACHASGQPLETQQLLKELLITRPLSVVMEEKVDYLRSWAAERTVPAS